MKNNYFFIKIILLTIIIQYIVNIILNIKDFSVTAFIRNCLFVFYLVLLFSKNKSLSTRYKQYKIYIPFLLILFYTFNYFMKTPEYIGQDIIALPLTYPMHLSVNLQKLQDASIKEQLFKESHISLDDMKYNFWYEYYNFLYEDKVYYFWTNRPAKYDNTLNVLLYYIDVETKETKFYLKDKVPKNSYISKKEGDNYISSIKTDILEYESIINYKNKTQDVVIKTNQISIQINGKTIMDDSYCGDSVIRNKFPFINKPYYYLKKYINLGLITDSKNENMNDTHIISETKITINNVEKDGLMWFDKYIGTGHYYMTHYFWTMNYSENWCIFILFYTDYPYNNSCSVCFIFNRPSKKTINIGVFKNTQNWKMLTGTESSIQLDKPPLCEKLINYQVNFKSPQVICKINGNNIKQVLNQFNMYQRDHNINYGKGEEIQKVMEQTVYSEFAGKSFLEIHYNGKIYKEPTKTVIDGIAWKDCKNNPDGYKKKEAGFFKDIFYVEHPDADKLNGKI